MFRRILVSSTLVAVLVIAGIPVLTGTSVAERFDWAAFTLDEAAAPVATNSNETETSDAPQKNGGNSFMRALGAPFRAISRLFGGGKNQKLRRISDKDAARFESTKLTRATDARIEAPAATTPSSATTPFNDHLQKGRELLNTGDLNGAIAELSTAASLDPKSGEANNLLGIAYESKGLRDRALKSFEAAVHADKNNAEFLNNFGFLLFKNGDFQKATKYLKSAAKLSPSNAQIWNNLAMAQSRLGKYDDALKSFVRAGGEVDGQTNIAQMLERAGRDTEANAHYQIAKQKAESERQANPNAQNIAVAVEIKNGQIVSASVQKHRAGMESYEISALRIARQRRYPSETTGTDLLAVRVSP